MKLAKYLVILVILLLGAYWGVWHYQMSKIIGDLNHRYAGKKFEVQGRDGADYHLTFEKAHSAGFPFKFGAELTGWKEETGSAEISYPEPISVGYDLFTQKIYVYYDGEIHALYKPVKNKFGARFEVKNYLITVAMPISKQLIWALENMKDPFEIVNHIGKIRASSDRVRIFDIQDGKKFYEKAFEEFELTFEPRKTYESLDDFMNNIPGKYHIDYRVKTAGGNEPARRLPVSMFYGFMTLPHDFHATARVDLETNARRFENIGQDIDMQVRGDFSSEMLDLRSYNLNYAARRGQSNPASREIGEFSIESNAKFYLKKGAFDEMFKRYDYIRPHLMNSAAGRILNKELEYVIKNRELFKFGDLEQSNYEFLIKATGSKNKSNVAMNLENFSLVGEQSGVKLSHQSNVRTHNPKHWNAKGVLLMQNYNAVVEFTSGYIYRFGKFKGLDDEARKIYVKVNKKFLKNISDYPKSESPDLSFEYEIDSKNLLQTKIGSVRFDQLGALYQAELFKELFKHVGPGGDVIGRMKKIIPELDENSEILKQIVPGLKKLDKLENLEKIVPKDLKKDLPKEAGDIIEKILPGKGKKKIDKGLWKNLLQ